MRPRRCETSKITASTNHKVLGSKEKTKKKSEIKGKTKAKGNDNRFNSDACHVFKCQGEIEKKQNCVVKMRIIEKTLFLRPQGVSFKI